MTPQQPQVVLSQRAILLSLQVANLSQAGYIFLLVPTATKTATPTIVCSRYSLGFEVDSLGIEAGIDKDGYRKVVSSSTTTQMQAFGSISGDILTATSHNPNWLKFLGQPHICLIPER